MWCGECGSCGVCEELLGSDDAFVCDDEFDTYSSLKLS